MSRRISPITVIIVLLFIFSAAVLGLASCAPQTGNVFSELVSSAPSSGFGQEQAGGDFSQQGQQGSGLTNDRLTNFNPANLAQQPPQERVILRSASLSLIVEATETALANISQMADEMGGWVVGSTTFRTTAASGEAIIRGSINIRVPSERLNEALERIKGEAKTVQAENVAGQDVTEEYVDLSSRLTNLEAAERQLQTIMDSARNTQDVLSVYNELVRIRGEIEVIRGRLRYFDEAAAYSSINVELIPDVDQAQVQIGGWDAGNTVNSAFNTLLRVLQFVVDVGITLAVLVLPLLAIVGIPFWIVRRWWLRRRPRPATPRG